MYLVISVLFASIYGLYSSDVVSLYYVESDNPSMSLGNRKICMKSVHDQLCSDEIPLTQAAKEQALPHTPNILGAAFTTVYEDGKIHTSFFKDDKRSLFFCSNASLEVRDGEKDKEGSTLFVSYLKAEQIQERLLTIAEATSQNCPDLHLPGMQRILDDKDRTQDCGHTEPKLIAYLMESIVSPLQSGRFVEMFGEAKKITSIVLNLHSYLYPCTTCKDILIHFGWYMNYILKERNIAFRIAMTYRYENGSRARPEELPLGKLSLVSKRPVLTELSEKVPQLNTPQSGPSVELKSRLRRSGVLQSSPNSSDESQSSSLSSFSGQKPSKLTHALLKKVMEERMPVLQLSAYTPKGVAPVVAEDQMLKIYRRSLGLAEKCFGRDISNLPETPRDVKRSKDETVVEGLKVSPPEKREFKRTP